MVRADKDMKKSLIKYFLIVILFFTLSEINSQTCGFGCLGLSGVYGGYSIQQYEATGLNEYLNSYSTIDDLNFNLQESKGLRVGMNIVRANYTNFFFSFKGFYQFLSEEQAKEISNIQSINILNAKMEINNWGFALDFGIPLFWIFDWKIVEGSISFFSPKLTVQKKFNDLIVEEEIFSPDRVRVGYSIGSGLIINIIQDYVSIEATGLYSVIEIDNLTSDSDGTKIPKENSNKLISQGGLRGIVQLNVGIPF